MWRPEATGQGLGALARAVRLYLLKGSHVESRSVRKTSLFTNTIPESASGTQFPPELVGSCKHVAVTLWVV